MTTGPPRRLLETVLYAEDLATTEAFYCDVLGLQPFARKLERQLFYRIGDQVLLIFKPSTTQQPPAPGALPVPTHGARGPGHVCFAASASEIEQWRSVLLNHGVEIEADFEWPTGGRSIYFRDPAGNSLEFAEPRLWGLS